MTLCCNHSLEPNFLIGPQTFFFGPQTFRRKLQSQHPIHRLSYGHTYFFNKYKNKVACGSKMKESLPKIRFTLISPFSICHHDIFSSKMPNDFQSSNYSIQFHFLYISCMFPTLVQLVNSYSSFEIKLRIHFIPESFQSSFQHSEGGQKMFDILNEQN